MFQVHKTADLSTLPQLNSSLFQNILQFLLSPPRLKTTCYYVILQGHGL